ncbi:MAG TPA: 2'-5' RNA ligase family protein [Nocardioidaceae bacterium]
MKTQVLAVQRVSTIPLMESRRAALIVEIPESEVAVSRQRMRLDRYAPIGVPAHVTALFPFVPAEQIDDEVLGRVVAVAEACDPFPYRFSRCDWFDDNVVFLAPDDPAPFSRLTETLWEAFPGCPPYGGQFDEPVPHLTIGEGDDEAALRQAESEVLAHGPVVGHASRLTLLTEDDEGFWARLGWFSLGSSASFRPA